MTSFSKQSTDRGGDGPLSSQSRGYKQLKALRGSTARSILTAVLTFAWVATMAHPSQAVATASEKGGPAAPKPVNFVVAGEPAPFALDAPVTDSSGPQPPESDKADQPKTGGVAGGSGSQTVAAAGGCAVQCITKAWLTPNASSPNLHLEVKTTTPAKLDVYLSKSPTHHTPAGHPYFTAPRPKASSSGLETQWDTTLKALTPDTRYYIIVKAVDDQGGTSYREGDVKTLKPVVDPQPQLADKGGPSGCATQCIKMAKVSPVDTSANLEVKTFVAAQMRVKVSKEAPKQGSNGPLFLDFDAWADSGHEYRDSWNTALAPLEADTLYHIGLWATDEQGRTTYQQGTFRTRKSSPPVHLHENKAVRITFHHVHVSNDADNGGLEPGKGELSFDFFVEGEHRPEMHQERRDIKSGQTVDVHFDGTTRPAMHLLLEQAPDTLDLRIFGEEKDSGFGKGGCVREAFSNPRPPGAGRDGCFEWNNAEASVDLHNLGSALFACPGLGIAEEDACFFVRATGDDPRFEVLVSLEFMDIE